MKRGVARHLGRFTFNNGVLQIELHEILDRVRYSWKKWESEIEMIEPLDIGSGSWKTGDLEPVIQRWQASFEKYRTLIAQHLRVGEPIAFPKIADQAETGNRLAPAQDR